MKAVGCRWIACSSGWKPVSYSASGHGSCHGSCKSIRRGPRGSATARSARGHWRSHPAGWSKPGVIRRIRKELRPRQVERAADPRAPRADRAGACSAREIRAHAASLHGTGVFAGRLDARRCRHGRTHGARSVPSLRGLNLRMWRRLTPEQLDRAFSHPEYWRPHGPLDHGPDGRT